MMISQLLSSMEMHDSCIYILHRSLVVYLVPASEIFITVYDSMCSSSTVTMLRLFMELETITPFKPTVVNQCEEGSFVISLIGVGEHYWIVNFGQPICHVCLALS
jgi:hypothetical protein